MLSAAAARSGAPRSRVQGQVAKEDPGVMKEVARGGDGVLASPELGLAAKVVERMVNQNTYDNIALDFKYWDDASDQFKQLEGTLLPLWKVTNERARKKAVTSVCWSPVVRAAPPPQASPRQAVDHCERVAQCPAMPALRGRGLSHPQATVLTPRSRLQYEGMFAIGYGSYDFLKPTAGLVCIFSLANPTYPEYTFTTDAGVLSVDFHPQHANLLAAGLYDGTVLVFDVARKDGALIYKSTVEAGTHSEPAWQVAWERADGAKALQLYSVSSDGHVLVWALSKSVLVPEVAMALRVDAADDGGGDALAGGCCFDFNQARPRRAALCAGNRLLRLTDAASRPPAAAACAMRTCLSTLYE
jgi:dynein intermediate chain 1, axonemal